VSIDQDPARALELVGQPDPPDHPRRPRLGTIRHLGSCGERRSASSFGEASRVRDQLLFSAGH
jgi:hypothetical protein